jgi:hypothetical protein
MAEDASIRLRFRVVGIEVMRPKWAIGSGEMSMGLRIAAKKIEPRSSQRTPGNTFLSK